MRNTISRMLGLTCFVAGVGLIAASCGGDNNGEQCEADQTFAAVNGVEKCYDNCVDGACSAGFSCEQDLCVATGAANNGTNNNGANNTNNNASNNASNNTTNNTTNNSTNNTTNNQSTNNDTTNTNNGTTNNGACTPLSPAIGDCDPICQTGCAAGEACVAGKTGPTAPLTAQCQPSGAGAAGDTCGGQEMLCQAGLGCFTSDGTTYTCQEFCATADGETACDEGAVCAPFDQDEQRVGICAVPTNQCTQYPNDSCPTGENCYLTNVGLRCAPHSPTAIAGDACASPTDCGDAQACIGGANGNVCANMCDPNNAMCAAGEQCAPLTGVTFGACVTP